MSVIADVRAREILDSRGNPTVEVEVSRVAGWGPRRDTAGRHRVGTRRSSSATATRSATAARAS